MSWLDRLGGIVPRRSNKKKKRRVEVVRSPRREPAFTSASQQERRERGESRISPARHRPARHRREETADGEASFLRRLLRRTVKWAAATSFTVVILILCGLVLMAMNLPDISRLTDIQKTPSITVRAASGDILRSYGDSYGDALTYRELPDSLVKAVLATEDRNFFHHFGIDPFGLVRASFANLRAKRLVQGGSTITQQVAKNIFLTPERTFKRKVQEALLAFWLEGRFTKEEILALYLNRVYMGAGNYGVDAASRRYFGKSARELTLSESAVLAGLLKAPSRYAPTSDSQRARKRADQVLLNMVDAGFITESQAQRAMTQLPKNLAASAVTGQGTGYFTDWVVDQLSEYVGDVQEDLVVTTTLDPKLQNAAEQSLAAVMTERGGQANASQGALVALRDDGSVAAMVGGVDYAQSQYNRAVQAMRQPGSAFKLFVYLAALEAGYSPDSVVEDQPITIGRWSPKNYSGRYEGPMSLRDAFAHSVNTIAVQLSEAVGRDKVIAMAARLGISEDIPSSPSIALGSAEVNLLELTGAFAHLESGGRSVFPHTIKEIRRADGSVLYRRQGVSGGAVLSGNTVAMMNSLMVAVVTSGTGKGAQFGRPVAGKTGTSQDFKDAWFVGFTPGMTAGVWVGNDDATPMQRVTGGSIPTAIWRGFMTEAAKKLPAGDIPTGYSTGFFNLPWGNGGTPENQRPATSGAGERSGGRDGGGVELSPSFWDKLFDGEVKHEYPHPGGGR